MQSLREFSANKSCPELSQDSRLCPDVQHTSSLSHSLSHSISGSLSDSPSHSHSHTRTHSLDSASEQIYLRTSSLPLLSQDEFAESSHDVTTDSPAHNMTTTTEDDVIEILSCHVEPEEDTASGPALMAVKIPPVPSIVETPSDAHRRRVARAIGVVTFLLLLFSIILIGISLNMSKDIDEMVRQSTISMRNPQPKFFTMMDNSSHLNNS
ncbi:uncharacterized protein LOC101858117 isoform X2 [Aplysia californica]|uniref:Uncharacterized protein LOC101858117 isoform X2 n=1 Tax=Aplysia californica TaxID=6500 RepID=A0ABM1A438_APLCA|nr:uncharacterized protein LOC101858117 isoform X2 [Aplysia californica]